MTQRAFLFSAIILSLLCSATVNGASIPNRVFQAAVEGQRVWVFLKDKGPDALKRLAPGTELVSARAAARIQARGQATDPTLDLPIDAAYQRVLTDAGMLLHQQSRWFNAVSGTVDPRDLESIAALPFVDSLEVVARLHTPLPETTIVSAELPRVARQSADRYDYGPSRTQLALIQVNLLHAAGLSGHGVRIGFLDTGFSLGITIFSHLNLVGTRDFINGDADVGDSDLAQMRHGTQTLSLCAGMHESKLVGVAPDAEYAVGKSEIVDQEIQIEEDNWVAGLEWLDSLGCDLVSSSLGYIDWYDDPDFDGNTAFCTIAADMAAARGMLVVNAVGNYGCGNGENRMIVPADGDSVLAVGACDSLGERASFSSCGPTYDGRIKPDVIAPGANVITALPLDTLYDRGSGTSFATPLVSGVCALLLENDPTLTPYGLIERVRSTATRARKPLSTYGWGVVQGFRAAGVDTSIVANGITAYPNPASEALTIAVPSSDAGDEWEVHVFTIDGRQVYHARHSGPSIQWRGVTDSGEKVATGVYLILVQTSVRKATLKVAWTGQ